MWNPFKLFSRKSARYDIFDVVLRGDTGEIQSLYRGHNLAPWHEAPGPSEFSCPAKQAPQDLPGLRTWIEARGGEVMKAGTTFGRPVFGVPDAYTVFRTGAGIGPLACGYMVRVPLN